MRDVVKKPAMPVTFKFGMAIALVIVTTVLTPVALKGQEAAHAGRFPGESTAQVSGSKPDLKIPDLSTLPLLPKTAETVDKVKALLEAGDRQLQLRAYDQGLQSLQEAYGMSVEMKYTEGQGQALTKMAALYLAQGKNIKAKQLAENAVEILSGAADKLALSRARVQLAHAYFAMDNPMWAAQQLEWAMKSFTEIDKDNAIDAARIASLSGDIVLRSGKLKEALTLYKAAATYYKTAGQPYQEMAARLTLLNSMVGCGLYVAAMDEAKEAIVSAEELADKDVLAAALASLGNCQYLLGEYANARKSYEAALSLASSFQDDLGKAKIEAGYGLTLAATTDLDQALEYLNRAYPVIKSQARSFTRATYLNALGNIFVLNGNPEKGSTYLKEALDSLSVVTGELPRFQATLLQNMAAAQARANHYSSAKTYLQSALEIAKRSKNKLLIGRSLTGLAEVCLNLKEFDAAEEFLEKGIEVSQQINDDAALWRSYTLKANLELGDGQVKKGRESLGSAISFFRSPQAGVFATPDRLSFPSAQEDLGCELVSLLVLEKQYEQALLVAEQLKEEAFLVAWQRRGMEVKSQDRDLYNDLLTRKGHLHAAEDGSTPDEITQDWKRWLGRFQQLAIDNRPLASLLAPVPIRIPEIQRAAVEGNLLLIDYLVGPSGTIIFTVDNKGRIRATEMDVGRRQLQQQVSSLLASAKNGSDQALIRRTLKMLYDELIPEAVKVMLPDDPEATVVILPDGILFNLPFAALINRDDKYLIENHTLTMAPSLGSFLGSPPRYSREVSLLMAGVAGAGHGRSAANARMIEELFAPGAVMRLSGADAQISELAEQARRKPVLHFTGSLPLRKSRGLEAHLPLFSRRENGDAQPVAASKLFILDLPSDLAVVDSSTVDEKDVEGQAVRLFSRGLNYAGVRNLLLSLWDSGDSGRMSELLEFYRSNQMGLSQAQSLRKAQLLALRDDPSPAKWAAFQLLGPGM